MFAPFRHLRMVCANPGNEAFSPTHPTERARERPWKTLVTWLQNKINSEEASFVSHFFVWFIRNVHVGRVGENPGNEVALGTAKITP